MIGQALTAALLASVFFGTDGLALVALVIVALVVAYVVRSNLLRQAAPAGEKPAQARTAAGT